MGPGVHQKRHHPSTSFGQSEKRRMLGNSSQASSNEAERRTWEIRPRRLGGLWEIPADPIVLAKYSVKVLAADQRPTSQELERKIRIGPSERGCLLACPDYVDAGDLANRSS